MTDVYVDDRPFEQPHRQSSTLTLPLSKLTTITLLGHSEAPAAYGFRSV